MGKLDKGAALGAALSVLAMDPALAEGTRPPFKLVNATNGQVTDCVAFVKGQRDLAKDNGIVMTRKDQKLMLLDCRGGQLDARIAEQNRIIAALDDELRKIKLRIDAKAQILDEHNRAIAQIISINGQWVIQRKLKTEIADVRADRSRTQADTNRMLDEAERILKGLATS